jgi:hypothetical protein
MGFGLTVAMLILYRHVTEGWTKYLEYTNASNSPAHSYRGFTSHSNRARTLRATFQPVCLNVMTEY